jgi:hypothetical protein
MKGQERGPWGYRGVSCRMKGQGRGAWGGRGVSCRMKRQGRAPWGYLGVSCRRDLTGKLGILISSSGDHLEGGIKKYTTCKNRGWMKERIWGGEIRKEE